MSARRDPFALPPASPSTTAAIAAAYAYVSESHDRRADPRDVLKDLVARHDATVSYPTYRTALRCGGIYSEAATSCAISTAKLLLDSFMTKAHQYLEQGEPDQRGLPGVWRS